MRASHSWLRGFVPHTLAPAEVERLFSRHVATVDAAEPLRADLAPFVIARVVEAGPHPDSDHLWVTKVDDGSGTLLDVVCGAPVVTVGTLYPFARTGTRMPSGITIERRKIRGELSNGMLCSARELGLGEDHSGIMALDIDVPPGTRFLDAVPVGDVAYEIDVLPNRPDLLSHIGLARELSALTGIAAVVPPELGDVPSSVNLGSARAEGTVGGVTVRIDDPACARYAAVVIRGIRVGPSPDWLRDRLQSIGLRSISNVVDVTNYFLHGFGQPMHAFDLAKLGGNAVVVRKAKPGEKLTTLDGVDRTLTGDMLVIADAQNATGIAGVIGGRASEVTDATTDVLLEVASFDARSVRRTRRALGINTDASHRFERGVDPSAPSDTAVLAAELIARLGGGRVEGALLVGDAPAPRGTIALRPSRTAKLLGIAVDAATITAKLSSIGFQVRTNGNDELAVTAPSWRHDVSRDVDLIEDIARLVGFDAFSDTLSPFRPSAVPDAPLHVTSTRVRDALVAAGFAEVQPLPFVRGDDATHVRVTNPLAEDEPHLRTQILETLARRAEYNLARREGNLRLFEIGSAFRAVPGSVEEERRVGVLLMGARRPVHFSESSPPVFDAWDAKDVAARIAGVAFGPAAFALVPAESPLLWRVEAGGRPVGTVGMVTLDAPPWAAPAFGVEITLGALPVAPVAPPNTHAYQETGSAAQPGAHRYRVLAVTPAAEFDLAFLVPDTLPAERIGETLRSTGGELLESVVLFDEFRGQGVPPGQRSLAWRLTFRHPERTLNEKEIAGRRQKLIATVEKEHGVVARTN